MDTYESALVMFAHALYESGLDIEHSNVFSVTAVNDFFDTLWFYRKNIHLLVAGIPEREGTDTSILDKLGEDLCVDISVGNTMYAVYVFRRDFKIITRNSELGWTFKVYTISPGDDKVAGGRNSVLQNVATPKFTIHLESGAETKRLFIEHEGIDSRAEMACKECSRCNKNRYHYGNVPVDMMLYPIKFRENCGFEEALHMENPWNIVKAVLHGIDCYVHRNTITRKNSKKREAYEKCKVHVAREDNNRDKYVMLPLHEYVREYREAHRGEYKGGHHKSPVAHTRRGYFRKARKSGDYIYSNGQFEYVGKGKGNFCFVRATRVNSSKEAVTVYVAPREEKKA